ncbi:MAG: hypothetical protein M0Z53_00905 [Thermaerobacter sp.]|nr:hypothetical protein [Thermaerobacter sp.]
MLTWSMLGTTAGAVVLVHAVLFLAGRLAPRASTTIVAGIAAEVIVWSYGAVTTAFSPMAALLWTSNGLVVATIALGGITASQQLDRHSGGTRT